MSPRNDDYEASLSKRAADRAIDALQGCTLTKEDALRIAEAVLQCVRPDPVAELPEFREPWGWNVGELTDGGH